MLWKTRLADQSNFKHLNDKNSFKNIGISFHFFSKNSQGLKLKRLFSICLDRGRIIFGVLVTNY